MDEGRKKRTADRKRRGTLLSSGKLSPQEEVHILNAEIQSLRGELRDAIADTVDAQMIRNKIFKLAESNPEPPKWLLRTEKIKRLLGYPNHICL